MQEKNAASLDCFRGLLLTQHCPVFAWGGGALPDCVVLVPLRRAADWSVSNSEVLL